jgi:hypothetical protein
MSKYTFALLGTAFLLCALFIFAAPAEARNDEPLASNPKGLEGPERVLVLDGSSVHNVGELQMHLLNWGEWGSRPRTAEPYSFAPSAQWPAGSGIEYLYSAGIWVGAIKNGIPAVSTSSYENEFRPSPDHRDKVYKTHETAKGGNRPPSAGEDDDGDGLVDEDYLDGYDNDGDGLVDEDFAAISTLMMACKYRDNEPVSRDIYPQHNPLNLLVRQESYQWDADRYDDFIGVKYYITNIGDDVLENVYVGFFVDGDAGPRTRSNYWDDDMTAYARTQFHCTDRGAVDGYAIAYTYDDDGDEGQTLGYFGVMLLDFTTDLLGVNAPHSVFPIAYTTFSGHQPFSLGGDPTTDSERYEVLSTPHIDPPSDLPRDYRMLVSIGPQAELDPDSTLIVQMAYVIGEGENGLLENASSCQLLFDGGWFDRDGDPTTGVEGRETAFHGPIQGGFWEDPCRNDDPLNPGCDWERYDDRFSKEMRHIPEGVTVWSNTDCYLECARKAYCGYQEADSFKFRTGVGGRETQIHWLIDVAPPPPNMRVDDHAKDGVVIYWDNLSEVVPDNVTNRIDFEGYRIWRAAGWTRPPGTSSATGPSTDLWGSLLQVDTPNNFGADTGINSLRYEPLRHILSAAREREFIESIKAYLQEYPGQEPFCPLGVSQAVCDTLKALARWELGLDGGRQYYRYVDHAAHLGLPYFYSVVAFDHEFDDAFRLVEGAYGDPASNFVYVTPRSAAQDAYDFDADRIYVVPNPVTRQSMAPWALSPNNFDPTGTKIEFRNLPKSAGTIRVYTLAGDLVKELHFDARNGVGTVTWDLVSRNGQDITSGVYLYAIEFDDNHFKRVVKKFTVIR